MQLLTAGLQDAAAPAAAAAVAAADTGVASADVKGGSVWEKAAALRLVVLCSVITYVRLALNDTVAAAAAAVAAAVAAAAAVILD